MKEVSFYVPCFNAENYIGECIESIEKQTYPVKEIILVDDGSTDRSVEIISSYPSVKIIKKKKNQGLASARNTGIENCSGEFIASCDSDVSLHRDWLMKIMENFSQDNLAGAGGKVIERNRDKMADRWRSHHLIQHWGDKKIINPGFLFGANTVFHKDTLLKVGKYNELYRTNREDVDLCERIKKSGTMILYEPEALAEHIRTDTVKSVINTYYGWKKYDYRQNNSFYDNFLLLNGKIKFSINVCYDMTNSDIKKNFMDMIYPTVLIMYRFILKDIKECKENRNELIIAYLAIKNILLHNNSIASELKDKIQEDITDLIPENHRRNILNEYIDKNTFIEKMKEIFKDFHINFISGLYNLIEDRTERIPSLYNMKNPITDNKERVKNFIQSRAGTSRRFVIWEKFRKMSEKSYLTMKHFSYSLLKKPSVKERDFFWELVRKSSNMF